MGRAVIIYGKSGSGKSRSLKNFAEDEIFLVNVMSKELPFRKQFKYTFCSRNYANIINGLEKMPTKTAVIDDAGYLMTNMFMNSHSGNKGGSSAFDLYNSIGDNWWNFFLFIKEKLPEDVIVYVMMHEDCKDSGDIKLRTIGRLLDEKVCIEGLVTVALRCMTDGKRHFFRTHSDGYDISKSPEEMFDDEIDNDLKMVDETIREYYNIKIKGDKK